MPRCSWLALVLSAGAAACGGPDFTFGDAGLDAQVVICPRLDLWQLRWSACPDPTACADTTPGVDNDGDGPNEAEGDCDDGDPWVHPGAREVCDLRDNDCDGVVDEGPGRGEDAVGEDAASDSACPDPITACPLAFADVSCCGAEHTIAGVFQVQGETLPQPMEVVVRNRVTREVRRAVTCPGAEAVPAGFPYRFRLADPDFIHPDTEYELIMHLRWYFPAVLDPTSCVILRPFVTTDEETAASCIDYGPFMLPCL